MPFFKTGPLAWDGLLTFWVAVSAFFLFVVVNGVMMLRALDAEQRSAEPAPEISRSSAPVPR